MHVTMQLVCQLILIITMSVVYHLQVPVETLNSLPSWRWFSMSDLLVWLLTDIWWILPYDKYCIMLNGIFLHLKMLIITKTKCVILECPPSYNMFNSLRPSDTYICWLYKHHWFRLWLVAWSVPCHYLNQCWNVVNGTLRKQLQWNFNKKSYIIFQENTLKMLSGNGGHLVLSSMY